jgi:hypothetical protein
MSLFLPHSIARLIAKRYYFCIKSWQKALRWLLTCQSKKTNANVIWWGFGLHRFYRFNDNFTSVLSIWVNILMWLPGTPNLPRFRHHSYLWVYRGESTEARQLYKMCSYCTNILMVSFTGTSIYCIMEKITLQAIILWIFSMKNEKNVGCVT